MKINQPADMNVNGTFEFKWSQNFSAATTARMLKTQEFIDAECIRLMIPYTPMKNGLLYKSATLGTVIGSGEIKQIMPYARYQYYGKVYGPNIPVLENGKCVGFFSKRGVKKTPTGADLRYSTEKHPLAGSMWFERMKAEHKDSILRGAEKIAGGNR